MTEGKRQKKSYGGYSTMIDWDFTLKVFFLSIFGTFFSMALLTFIIEVIGIIFNRYGNHQEDLKE